MLKRLTLIICGALLAFASPLAAEAKTYFWISHGSPADPVWTYFLAGANQWAKDTGNTVKTIHAGSVPERRAPRVCQMRQAGVRRPYTGRQSVRNSRIRHR